MMLYMFKIQRIDVNNENAKNNFFTSFQNTGFAVIENHGISYELIDKVYEEWKQFFYSKDKYDYKFNTDTQDGFFPFRSESAKDNPVKDLKEFFHIYKFLFFIGSLSPLIAGMSGFPVGSIGISLTTSISFGILYIASSFV